jgi:hypothetical protein
VANFVNNVLTPTSPQTMNNFVTVGTITIGGEGVALKASASLKAARAGIDAIGAAARKRAAGNLLKALPAAWQEEEAAAARAGWIRPDGTPWYPPDDGALGAPVKTTLQPGTLIDRYSADPEQGSFFSPVGTPLDARALPPGSEAKPLVEYVIAKPLPVQESTVAPWFGQPGLGTQYQITEKKLLEYIADGTIKIVTKP